MASSKTLQGETSLPNPIRNTVSDERVLSGGNGINLIIINYHYIRERGDNGIHPCTIENFEKQMRFLDERYAFVSVGEIYRAALENRGGKLCAVTFDDGLAEHYNVALPILKQYKARAAFFPIGLPLEEKRMPLTHKLHILLSKIPILDLVRKVEDFFDGRVRISGERLINPKRRFDDILTSNLKETLIALTVEERSGLIEKLFGQSYSSEQERELAEGFFMSAEELGELKANGMDIGSHTYSHLALDTLNRSEQLEEVARGQKAICDALGSDSDMFVYPHGRYNADTLGIMKDLNFKLAFTLGARDVAPGDDAFEIPRYDTNDLANFKL